MVNLYNMDCMELLSGLPDKSVDFVCIDPPYGILTGHKIETVLDIPKLTQEIHRVSKPDTFFAFFGMMPTIVEWYLEALKVGFKFRLDIVWAKRTQSSPFQQVLRTKELIYVLSKGNAKYIDTKECYEDIRIPMLELGLISDEAIKRYITSARSGKTSVKPKGKPNDEIYDFGNKTSDRASEFINVTDVWSFTPENKRNNNANNHEHPTVKPVKLLQRLIKLCTTENATVLDCFSGSGTTAIACIMENRNFIGSELDATYYENSLKRIETAQMQPKLF